MQGYAFCFVGMLRSSAVYLSAYLATTYIEGKRAAVSSLLSLDEWYAQNTRKLACKGIRDAVATMKRYSGEQELTKEIADEFMDRILLYDPRHIEIQWKFPDEVIEFIEG